MELSCMVNSFLTLIIMTIFATGVSFKSNPFYRSNKYTTKAVSSKMSTTSTTSSSPQILRFIEPTTNTEVILVGVMHYNPASINLATTTIEYFGNLNRLGGVVLETCPIRWNKTLTMQNGQGAGGSLFKQFLHNEMQAAYNTALKYNAPIILGDQYINITNSNIGNAMKQTIKDVLTPFNGWSSLYNDVSRAIEEALPSGPNYLGLSDYFDSKLMLAAPVSLIRYPLAFIIKAPKKSIPFLSAMILLAASSNQFSMGDSLTSTASFTEILSSFASISAEFLLLSRVFLIAILSERNVILAENILAQCRKINNNNGKNSLESPKTVIAILGMAHCNGIKKILTS
eukprot:gene9371-12627_t